MRYPQGIVQGLFRTDPCSQPGESGAPLVAGDQAQGVISGDSGSPGTGCLAFFQNVDPLLNT